MTKRSLCSNCALLWLVCCSGVSLADGLADQVTPALSVAVQGRVMRAQEPLEPFTPLNDGDLIELSSGATAIVVFSAPPIEYTLTGPARIRIDTNKVQVVTGQAPMERALFARSDIQLSRGFMHHASFKTRSDTARHELVISHPNTTFSNAKPTFEWSTRDIPGPVRLTLYDTAAEILLQIPKAISPLALPDSIDLRLKGHYTWLLEARTSEGRSVRAQGDFIVADADQLRWRNTLSDCDRSLSSQVVCALLLEEAGFQFDADIYWRQLLTQAPDNPWIQARRRIEK